MKEKPRFGWGWVGATSSRGFGLGGVSFRGFGSWGQAPAKAAPADGALVKAGAAAKSSSADASEDEDPPELEDESADELDSESDEDGDGSWTGKGSAAGDPVGSDAGALVEITQPSVFVPLPATTLQEQDLEQEAFANRKVQGEKDEQVEELVRNMRKEVEQLKASKKRKTFGPVSMQDDDGVFGPEETFEEAAEIAVGVAKPKELVRQRDLLSAARNRMATLQREAEGQVQDLRDGVLALDTAMRECYGDKWLDRLTSADDWQTAAKINAARLEQAEKEAKRLADPEPQVLAVSDGLMPLPVHYELLDDDDDDWETGRPRGSSKRGLRTSQGSAALLVSMPGPTSASTPITLVPYQPPSGALPVQPARAVSRMPSDRWGDEDDLPAAMPAPVPLSVPTQLQAQPPEPVTLPSVTRQVDQTQAAGRPRMARLASDRWDEEVDRGGQEEPLPTRPTLPATALPLSAGSASPAVTLSESLFAPPAPPAAPVSQFKITRRPLALALSVEDDQHTLRAVSQTGLLGVRSVAAASPVAASSSTPVATGSPTASTAAQPTAAAPSTSPLKASIAGSSPLGPMLARKPTRGADKRPEEVRAAPPSPAPMASPVPVNLQAAVAVAQAQEPHAVDDDNWDE